MPRASSTPARPGLRPMSTSNSRKAAGARTRRRCAGAPPARRSSGPPRRSTPSAGNLLAPLAGRGGRATRLPRGGPARPAQHGTEHDADLAALAPPDLGADHGAAGRQMELEDARDGERIGKRQPRAAAREVPDRAIDLEPVGAEDDLAGQEGPVALALSSLVHDSFSRAEARRE